MRNFIISIVCLTLLTGIWAVFYSYSNKTLHLYIDQIETSIIKNVETENWDKASDSFDALSENWHHYKKRAAFFMDTMAINDTDYSFARAKYYIRAKDVSNASGELSCLKEQLTFLHKNETVALENIL
ncbi:MAG: DUF4363 family protein [Anaerovoracaceae bacterium]